MNRTSAPSRIDSALTPRIACRQTLWATSAAPLFGIRPNSTCRLQPPSPTERPDARILYYIFYNFFFPYSRERYAANLSFRPSFMPLFHRLRMRGRLLQGARGQEQAASSAPQV